MSFAPLDGMQRLRFSWGLGCVLATGCSPGLVSEPGTSAAHAVDASRDEASADDVAQLPGTTASNPAHSSPHPSGTGCSGGKTTLVQPFWTEEAAFAGGVSDIIVTGSDVYFMPVGPGGASVWRASTGGGQPTKLLSIRGEGDGMLATSTSVLLAESQQGMAGEIVQLSAAGGSPITLARTKGPVRSLVTDGTRLFFADDAGISSVPIAGGAAQMLSSRTGMLALVGPNLVLADSSAGSLLAIPKTGGAPTVLAADQSEPGHPVDCDGDVCWIDAFPCAGLPPGDTCVVGEGEGAIMRMAMSGAPITLARDPTLYWATGMVFDGASFFVTTGADASPDGLLTRTAAGGGAPIVIGSADSIAIAGGRVYVLDYIEGVYSVPTSCSPADQDE